ncbi:MAG TPA: BlaI/MecI/CopY family transcriptional regulator [Chthonomonadaceae bacterium]|nr:BlaI/MecI/CopY family transcriptional regulator [Chthonomonadaceae bacterium]
MRHQPQPTEAEYAILQVLWRLGAGTVRDVHRIMNQSREIGYTSVLKTLQVMTEKGLVIRNEQERAHVYTPAFSEETTQGGILRDLLRRVFSGSPQRLVMRALEVQPATPEERAEIRRLLDALDQQGEESRKDKSSEDQSSRDKTGQPSREDSPC